MSRPSSVLHQLAVRVLLSTEQCILIAARPLNAVLARRYRNRSIPGSVLHISGMVHIPWLTVQVLRSHGVRADYMATTSSNVWEDCDFHVVYSRWGPIRAIQQIVWFWRVVARYEVIHSHFMMTLTPTGWELPLLRKMGRSLVVNFRGCDIRTREANMALHPSLNICQDCDYWVAARGMYACEQPELERQRRWAREFGDLVLVTTPDMKDFWPDAVHFPFFAPELPEPFSAERTRSQRDGIVKIVHATNHPGIEGTKQIMDVVESLQAAGYPVEFCLLKGVNYETVLKEMADADLAIGKMKMGYYANAQIESMMQGVPTVTWVRQEFMTAELEESGFIFSSLEDLEETLRRLLDDPDQLAAKRAIARDSIKRLHDNDILAARLIAMYARLRGRDRFVPDSHEGSSGSVEKGIE